MHSCAVRTVEEETQRPAARTALYNIEHSKNWQTEISLRTSMT